MFGIWSVIFGFLTIKFARLDLSLFLGFVLGGAMLTKSPALVFVGLLPLLLIFYTSPSKNQLSSIDKYLQQRLNPHVVKLAKLSFLYVVALVLAVVMYNILRLGPNFSMAGSRNFDYVFPLSEVFTHPFNPLIGNLKNTFSWYLNFVTPPILILGFLSVLYPRKKIVILLALFVVLPLLMQGFIAKVYTTRYFLYTVPYFLILASLGITSIKRFKPLQIGAVLFVLASTLYYNYFLWFDVTKAPLPQQMAHGYFQEWTAGFGQKEVADYLKSKPKDTKILVGTEGFFGSLPDGLQIFTEGRPNIVVVGLGHPVFSVSEKLTNALIDNEVYLVVNKSRDLIPVSERGRLHLVAEYEKPPRPDGTREVLEFFQVK
jgi:hypothetical protein